MKYFRCIGFFVLLTGILLARNGSRANQADPGAEQKFKSLSDEYSKAYRAYLQERDREAKEAGKGSAEAAAPGGKKPQDVAQEFVPRFAAAASEFEGQEGAIQFLIWVVHNDSSADEQYARPALATLLDRHMGSKRLIPYARTLFLMARRKGEAETRRVMDRIIRESPHPEVRATALYARANLGSGRYASRTDEKSLVAAKRDLTNAMAEAPGTRIAKDAEGLLFEIEHLQIGMTAPEIEGKDLDGAAFKLSDYRGKVVLLDFWGDW